MISVIIAGGSGSRLWPVSTPEYPKHLLPLTGTKALIQYAYDRARIMSDEVYVITEASHAQHVRQLLPEIKDNNLIVEPARRGTASCIVAALDRISRSHDMAETVAFMHADHYIRDTKGFKYSFEAASKASSDSKSIVLIGVEPTYPSTGFGYIQKGEKHGVGPFAFKVKLFKEKPDLKTAQKYLRSGEYLWNCGFFFGLSGHILNIDETVRSLPTRLLQKTTKDSNKY